MRNKAKPVEEVADPLTVKTPTAPNPRTRVLSLSRLGLTQAVLIGLGLFLVAMGFKLYQIGSPSLWFDEILSVSVLRWRTVQIVIGLCLVLLCLFSVPGYYNNAQVEDWRTGTLWLQHHYQSGDGLICYDNEEGCATGIEYYLRAYPHGAAHFDADSPGYFPWVSYDETNQLGDYTQALSINAIQLYATKHPRRFFSSGRVDPTDPSP